MSKRKLFQGVRALLLMAMLLSPMVIPESAQAATCVNGSGTSWRQGSDGEIHHYVYFYAAFSAADYKVYRNNNFVPNASLWGHPSPPSGYVEAGFPWPAYIPRPSANSWRICGV